MVEVIKKFTINNIYVMLFLLLLTFGVNSVFANNFIWFGTGYGVYNLKNTFGLTQGMGNFNFSTNNLLIQLRVMSLLGMKNDTIPGVNQCVDAGLLGGYVWNINNNNININLAGGVSFVYSNQEIKYRDTLQLSQGNFLIKNEPVYKTTRNIGFPIEAEILFLFSDNIAAGIAVSSNLNIYVPYLGIAAIIEYGVLR